MKQRVEVEEELQQQGLEEEELQQQGLEEEELLIAELQQAEEGDRRVKQHTHTQVMIRICHQMPLSEIQSYLSTQYC